MGAQLENVYNNSGIITDVALVVYVARPLSIKSVPPTQS